MFLNFVACSSSRFVSPLLSNPSPLSFSLRFPPTRSPPIHLSLVNRPDIFIDASPPPPPRRLNNRELHRPAFVHPSFKGYRVIPRIALFFLFFLSLSLFLPRCAQKRPSRIPFRRVIIRNTAQSSIPLARISGKERAIRVFSQE